MQQFNINKIPNKGQAMFFLKFFFPCIDIINSHNPKPDLNYVLNTIAHENWEFLPPGGGLFAK